MIKMLDLYKNIRKFRIEQKMTQDELARRTGYTDRSSIAKIERGDVDLPQSKIILIANALGVSAGTLMGNSGVESTVFLRPDETNLLNNYNLLNDNGKDKAQEYVEDLSDNPKYTEEVWLNAAHQRTDTELSGTSHDDDIMGNPEEWE